MTGIVERIIQSPYGVPLNPMVLLIKIPVFKWLFHWEYTLFSSKVHIGMTGTHLE